MSRKTDPELLTVTARAPWRVGMVLAAAAYMLLGAVLPGMLGANPLTQGVAAAAATLAPYVALPFWGRQPPRC